MEKLLLSKVLKQMFEVVPKSYTLKNQGTDVSNYNTFDQYGHMVNSVNFLKDMIISTYIRISGII